MIIIKSDVNKIKWICAIIVIICVLILFSLFYGFRRQPMLENFEDPIIEKEISLEEFNEKFGSEMIVLPNNITAIGYEGNNMYTYNKPSDTSNNYTRIPTFTDYFNSEIKSSIEKWKFYFVMCFYDGYRERIRKSKGELSPYYPTSNEFLNYDEIKLDDNTKYPIFHRNKTVFAFCKHTNDSNTICVPDFHYIAFKGYVDNFKEIDDHFIEFDNKTQKCVWRGKIQNSSVFNFIDPEDKNGVSQREYFVSLFKKGAFKSIDYSEEFMPISEQIKYKYILDIDGHSSTWDATAWKLYSGSVLLKVESIWEQWFYKDLIEWVHYVPVKNDFSDLNEKIEWCMSNDGKCRQIAKNAREFAIYTYNWDNVKNYTIDVFNNYT